jgi:hypothetical protein
MQGDLYLASFIPMMVAVTYTETLEQLRHATRLSLESRNYKLGARIECRRTKLFPLFSVEKGTTQMQLIEQITNEFLCLRI